MVAQATSSEQTESGLRLIHSSRDVVAVSRLVERAFAEDMDASGRRAMREMRWLGTLFGWMDMFGMPGQGMLPGFVWVEDGVIVGNATVRRLGSFGHGWMIGNVAVDPAWRRRGIARQLMQASLDLAREHDADWIALQVRSDNAAAHDLYKSLGFEDTGETVYFERVQFDPIEPPSQPVEGRMRPATNADVDRIFTLAQSTVPGLDSRGLPSSSERRNTSTSSAELISRLARPESRSSRRKGLSGGSGLMRAANSGLPESSVKNACATLPVFGMVIRRCSRPRTSNPVNTQIVPSRFTVITVARTKFSSRAYRKRMRASARP